MNKWNSITETVNKFKKKARRRSTLHKCIHILVLLAISFISGYAKTDYRDLVANAIYVENVGNIGVNEDRIQFHIPNFAKPEYDVGNFYNLIGMLQKDVIGYHALEQKYNTELKRKVFLESKEAKDLLNEMETIYNEIKTKDFYYLRDFNSIYHTKYNLSTQSMDTEILISRDQSGIPFNQRSVKTGTPYISFGSLWLSIPNTITIKQGVFQNVTIPLQNQAMALEIEENIEDCALLVVFNLDKVIDERPHRGIVISGNTKYAYIVNRRTGKIYSDSIITL